MRERVKDWFSSFIIGVGKSLDIFPQLRQPDFGTDGEGIAADWRAVGDDMRQAASKMGEELAADRQKKEPLQTVRSGLYRHYKGKYYFVFFISTHSETEEACAVYMPLYGDYRITHRPVAMFAEEVDKPEFNYKGPRFEFIADIE